MTDRLAEIEEELRIEKELGGSYARSVDDVCYLLGRVKESEARLAAAMKEKDAAIELVVELKKVLLELTLTVNEMRDRWAEAEGDNARRNELWRNVHSSADVAWKLLTDLNEGRHPSISLQPASGDKGEGR